MESLCSKEGLRIETQNYLWRYALPIITLCNLPLLIITWDNPWYGDDYDNVIAPFIESGGSFSREVLFSFFEPIPRNHFVPVQRTLNHVLLSINNTYQFFHLVMIFFHIGTAILVYQIVNKTITHQRVALLAAILFSLSFGLNQRVLLYNVMGAHIVNSFTGLAALYLTLQYLQTLKIKKLAIASGLLVVTILNGETGFSFVAAIGIFVTLELYRKRISVRQFAPITAMLFLVTLTYAISANHALRSINEPPLLLTRVINPDNELMKNNILARRGSIDDEIDLEAIKNRKGELTIQEMRLNSPPPPRIGAVFGLRSIDLFLNTTNLSIVEHLMRLLPKNNKVAIKRAILTSDKKLLLVGMVIAFAIFIWLVIYFCRSLPSEAHPFLGTYIFLFAAFVFIYNRNDLAYPMAIFSSGVIASFTIDFKSVGKSNYRIPGICYLVVFSALSFCYMATGFDRVYETTPRNIRVADQKWIEKISSGIGGLSGETLVLVHKRANLKIPKINDKTPVFRADYSLYHITQYHSQFKELGIGESYDSRWSVGEKEGKRIWKMIGFLEVDDLHEAVNAVESTYLGGNAIYVNEHDAIEQL